jgi:endonuclease/exonuclease/phosphatase family metal-dependent hydrolase
MGRTWSLVLLIVLACAASGCASLHWGTEYPCSDSSSPAVAPGLPKGDLHVISWNLHGTPEHGLREDRFRRVARALLERGPDLILLQEVWFKGDAAFLESELSRRYNRIADDPQVGEGPLATLIGRRQGGLLAFMRKDSAWKRPTNSRFLQFEAGAPAYRVLELDGVSAKGVQMFYLSQPELQVVVFNTHLQSPYGEDRKYEEERRAQVKELEGAIATYQAAGDGRTVRLVFGDFNTVPEELFKFFKGSWTELSEQTRKTCNCQGTHLNPVGKDRSKAEEGKWIDYALTPAGTDVRIAHTELVRSGSIDCPFSDHYGLDFRFGLR